MAACPLPGQRGLAGLPWPQQHHRWKLRQHLAELKFCCSTYHGRDYLCKSSNEWSIYTVNNCLVMP
jgi:hypothetical protein